MKPIDKLGKEIKVGSYIAYGHNLGRCAGIRIGKVLEIKEHINEHTKTYWNEQFRFIVRGINDDWSYRNQLELNSKNGTLMYSDRILVLEDIPEKYKELLKEV